MEITEVRVKLVDGKQDKLKAFCSITIDDAFVVRDLKIIEGTKGLFVAMPSRKLTMRCSKCGCKNQMKSNYCAECGYAMPADRGSRGRDGRQKMHADIAHPINSTCREMIQTRVLESFEAEVVASSQPGYQPQSLEEDLDVDEASMPQLHTSPIMADAAVAETPVTPVESPSQADRLQLGAGEAAADRRPRQESGTEERRREPRDRDRGQQERGPNRAERGPNRERTESPRREPRRARENGDRDRRGGRTDAERSDRNMSEPRESAGPRDRRGRDRVRDGARDRDGQAQRREGTGGRDGNGRDRGSEKRGRDERKDEALQPLARKPKKMIEPDDPPPDDNFGAGIF